MGATHCGTAVAPAGFERQRATSQAQLSANVEEGSINPEAIILAKQEMFRNVLIRITPHALLMIALKI